MWGSGEEVVEDLEGVDVEGGFGVEFDVAEDFLGDFVAGPAVEWDEHRFGESGRHKAFYHRIMDACEGGKISGFGTEAEGDGKFKEETDMEIAEVSLNAVQQEDIPFTQLVKALFGSSVPDHPVKNLADEHCHRILEDIVPYSEKGMLCRKITGCEEVRLIVFLNIRFEDVEGKEERHCHFLAYSPYQKASPPIFPAEGMDDYGILTELGGVKNY